MKFSAKNVPPARNAAASTADSASGRKFARDAKFMSTGRPTIGAAHSRCAHRTFYERRHEHRAPTPPTGGGTALGRSGVARHQALDRMPSDGEVIEGESEVDEAPVTGESVPVAKGVRSSLCAGSINAYGVLPVRITRTAADNTIARIIHLVEEAQGSKAPTACFIDRFAAYYTPMAMAFVGLIILSPTGLVRRVPVDLGLSRARHASDRVPLRARTPAAIASGLAAGATGGLLIKGGSALETLGKAVTIAFDKTGTLTVGKPQVTDVVAIEGGEHELLANAAAVERGSSHRLGLAIVAAAER